VLECALLLKFSISVSASYLSGELGEFKTVKLTHKKLKKLFKNKWINIFENIFSLFGAN
jgi:hypothetical protein